MPGDMVATRSKVLFGNRHLLAIAATINDMAPALRAKDLEEGMGLPASTVHRSLMTLAEVGLLRREPRGPGERQQFYTRLPHPFWDAARLLREGAVSEHVPAAFGGRP